ncbi:nucleotidyl transferase AbiEii/AbiGii toxin family protein [Simiduia curdlanivorans]|uniref:Nucleotidyl transferase AbiEii/AbiGii toxin family protein n=1 Tax=Simiduia curdlanivorans TaxID=1492769 RepID=A0ABV8V6A7_9GAMM|nr:nucleotidyl transferase AbiEii/AbiGii toxin family protein [Simiduia curdlanivorans]MDN3638751.1 nucleotidyl transferase AbiEii/AbiGii toxin family protein [Simiduia curdlanivorans]
MNTTKNIAASVRQKLLNRARTDKRPFAELLQYYAMERFLYRLSQSAHSKHYILKGALMLRVWESPLSSKIEGRPTMDIDMLGKTSNDEANIVSQITEVLNLAVEPDGLRFDVDSIQSERIKEDADYQGLRIRFRGTIDSARINMQCDIGFGDIVHPSPEECDLPTMLDFTAPRLLCYSRESAIAEKFEAMVKLGILNSRMKDFYDIWLLSRQFNFNGSQLAKAIQLTFKQRGTVPSDNIVAFQAQFIEEKQVQWTAFCRRINQEYLPNDFSDIVVQLTSFLGPIIDATCAGQPFDKNWMAANEWR